MQTAVIPTVVLCEPFAKVNKFYKDNLVDLFQTSTTQIFKNKWLVFKLKVEKHVLFWKSCQYTLGYTLPC